MKGKLVSWKNIDQFREFSTTYKNPETAFKTAAEAIKDWAQEELDELTGQDLDEEGEENLEHLRNALAAFSAGKWEETYDQWRYFADWADPREDVMIEDTEIVED